MTPILIVIVGIGVLILGYIFYGAWLAKQWGVDSKRQTPAVELEDGVDYVAAKPAVLMGHHFSSIAGAGPVYGPIQASVFGWVPVFLWCIIGGIFIGGVHDYGSLFVSIRNKGKSLGESIRDTMGKSAQKIFIVFALLIMILVLASFVNIVVGTFMSDSNFGVTKNPSGNETTAMISMLFIVLALIYGYITNRCGVRTIPATVMGIVGIIIIVIFGLNFGFAMTRIEWVIFIGIYITVASLVPVWILLQPRDYLSSFLLYGMMALAFIGIFANGFTHNATFEIPAFTKWNTSIGPLFPTLFITVACGACSGFHSLVATGTSSKQLDNEKNAKPIAYGSMLIECGLGIVALIALGTVYKQYIAGGFSGPTDAFATGIATMFSTKGATSYGTIYALLTLAVSVFALTTLDTGTRLARFLFSELFLKEGEKSWRDATGIRKILTFPLFGTAVMVVTGCILGTLSLSQIWALLGTVNQLLAVLALVSIASWLGKIKRNNKMLILPILFMFAVAVTSLVIAVKTKYVLIVAGTAQWGDWFQFLFGIVMGILALMLIYKGVQKFREYRKQRLAHNE